MAFQSLSQCINDLKKALSETPIKHDKVVSQVARFYNQVHGNTQGKLDSALKENVTEAIKEWNTPNETKYNQIPFTQAELGQVRMILKSEKSNISLTDFNIHDNGNNFLDAANNAIRERKAEAYTELHHFLNKTTTNHVSTQQAEMFNSLLMQMSDPKKGFDIIMAEKAGLNSTSVNNIIAIHQSDECRKFPAHEQMTKNLVQLAETVEKRENLREKGRVLEKQNHKDLSGNRKVISEQEKRNRAQSQSQKMTAPDKAKMPETQPNPVRRKVLHRELARDNSFKPRGPGRTP